MIQISQRQWTINEIGDRLDYLHHKLDTLITQNEVKEKRQKFIKPTVTEWESYAGERGIALGDAASFFDYYETNGWVQGKSRKPIKNWRAAFRTCEKRMGMKVNKPTKESENERRYRIICDSIIKNGPSTLIWSDYIVQQYLALPLEWQEIVDQSLTDDQQYWLSETRKLREND